MRFDFTALTKLMSDYVLPALGICAWLFLGFWLAAFLSRLVYGLLSRKVGADAARTSAKIVKYVIWMLVVGGLVECVGLDVRALLGAAGVAGVAIGFASQASLSNLISGMFLVLEHPFKVGDWIEVDDVSGYVHSIGLLSTYIRTFDNRLIRIPNETVSKSKLTNFTKYAIRRLDLTIRVSCKEDAAQVMRIFREVVIANPACFNEPEPLIVFKEFGESSLDFMLAVWTDRNEMQSTRTSLMLDIKERFDREGIELPYERLASVEEQPKRAPNGEKRD